MAPKYTKIVTKYLSDFPAATGHTPYPIVTLFFLRKFLCSFSLCLNIFRPETQQV
jgi:hypothetical protein